MLSLFVHPFNHQKFVWPASVFYKYLWHGAFVFPERTNKTDRMSTKIKATETFTCMWAILVKIVHTLSERCDSRASLHFSGLYFMFTSIWLVAVEWETVELLRLLLIHIDLGGNKCDTPEHKIFPQEFLHSSLWIHSKVISSPAEPTKDTVTVEDLHWRCCPEKRLVKLPEERCFHHLLTLNNIPNILWKSSSFSTLVYDQLS